jgi:hypothetical protein
LKAKFAVPKDAVDFDCLPREEIRRAKSRYQGHTHRVQGDRSTAMTTGTVASRLAGRRIDLGRRIRSTWRPPSSSYRAISARLRRLGVSERRYATHGERCSTRSGCDRSDGRSWHRAVFSRGARHGMAGTRRPHGSARRASRDVPARFPTRYNDRAQGPARRPCRHLA